MNPHREPFVRELVLRREAVRSFDTYPYAIPAIRALDRLPFHPGVTFLVGENGSGKSTILEAIAILAGMNPEGGSKNFSSSTYRSESSLSEHAHLVRGVRRERAGFFLRAETMFNVATEVERSRLAEYGWRNLHTQSHGESFLWTIANRFHGQGLYVLDEPEAALSPQRQLTLVGHLHRLAQQGAQFIISTHSPILVAYPEAFVYQLSGDQVPPCRVTLRETAAYQVTRAVLTHPELAMDELLGRRDER